MPAVGSATPFVAGLVGAGALSAGWHVGVVATGSGTDDQQAHRFTTKALLPAGGAALVTGYLGSVISPVGSEAARLGWTGVSMGIATGMGVGLVAFGKHMGWIGSAADAV